jgi:hypothetical protein
MRRNRLALVEEVYGYAMKDSKCLRRPQSHFLDLVIDGPPCGTGSRTAPT